MSSYISTIKEIATDHKEYREQTFKMAKSDIIRTYRGSALGWIWAVIKPVITVFIYFFAMSVGLKASKDIDGYPYFLFLIAGLVPWFYISDMFNRGTDCMRKYRYLITKMHYPVSTIPTFVSIANISVNLIIFVVVMILNICLGFPPNLHWLQIPIMYLFMFLFFTAWALFSGPISALSQDFSNLIKSLVFALLWGSAIFYPVSTFDSVVLQWIFKVNPITYIVSGIRAGFMGTQWLWETPLETGIFLAELLLMMFLGVWSYKKLRKEIPDVL